jgi:DNA-binding NarL/FixJ family response regulator/tRNA A-37 threonylcarbamoyl transferase component Bud32
MDSRAVTVLIVDDQPIVRAGLRISLEKLKRHRVVGESANGESAVTDAQSLRPDVVLMDMRLPGMDGAEATWRIKQESPHMRVLVLTNLDKPKDITAALGAGADGYCLKDASVEQIASAIDAVACGEVWIDPKLAESVMLQHNEATGKHDQEARLSATEIRVLELISAGFEKIGIAGDMQMDAAAVVGVMRNIIRRYSENSRKMAMQPDSVSVPKIVTDRRFSHEWFAATLEASEGVVVAEKYLLEELLGEGGVGTVFKARHLYMDRAVALKLLQPKYAEDAQVIRAFQNEAKALASFKHRNIVDVYDFGVTALGQPYLVMEFIKGTDLDMVLQSDQNRKLEYRRFLSIFLQICEALAAAHARDIIHCDLKPSNIFVLQGSDETEEVIKLVDFGLAKSVPRNATTQSQATDSFLINGTPSYMPPEQCSGRGIDKRSDIYALGCVMYEALAGINPFLADSPMETFAKQFEFTPPPVSGFCPETPIHPELEQCIGKMLAKDPTQRPQSVQEVRAVLHQRDRAVR